MSSPTIASSGRKHRNTTPAPPDKLFEVKVMRKGVCIEVLNEHTSRSALMIKQKIKEHFPHAYPYLTDVELSVMDESSVHLVKAVFDKDLFTTLKADIAFQHWDINIVMANSIDVAFL